MSKFVIRNKKDGTYYTGTASSWTRRFVDTIDHARVYGRKCDATNSIVGVFPRSIDGPYSYRNSYIPTALRGVLQSDLEVVPVTLSISTSNEPTMQISPEVLDRATRFMMTDEAKNKGAPASLVASFDDLETNEIVKLVTLLYGNK